MSSGWFSEVPHLNDTTHSIPREWGRGLRCSLTVDFFLELYYCLLKYPKIDFTFSKHLISIRNQCSQLSWIILIPLYQFYWTRVLIFNNCIYIYTFFWWRWGWWVIMADVTSASWIFSKGHVKENKWGMLNCKNWASNLIEKKRKIILTFT